MNRAQILLISKTVEDLTIQVKNEIQSKIQNLKNEESTYVNISTLFFQRNKLLKCSIKPIF